MSEWPRFYGSFEIVDGAAAAILTKEMERIGLSGPPYMTVYIGGNGLVTCHFGPKATKETNLITFRSLGSGQLRYFSFNCGTVEIGHMSPNGISPELYHVILGCVETVASHIGSQTYAIATQISGQESLQAFLDRHWTELAGFRHRTTDNKTSVFGKDLTETEEDEIKIKFDWY